MKTKTALLLGLVFILLPESGLFSQENFTNSAKISSLEMLDADEIIEYCNSGFDLNEKLIIADDYECTTFMILAHSYGFYCDDSSKNAVYYMVEHSEAPLFNPFFFLNDACWERISDVLIYYELLLANNHSVTEKDFHEIEIAYYLDHLNYKNEVGKTILMYACQFGYSESVRRIIDGLADVNLTDNNKKTALMYACEFGDLETIEFLLKKGAMVEKKDTNGKTALDYCSDKASQKLISKKLKKAED